jgi:TPR repeat protein
MLSRCCYYGVGTATDYSRAFELARGSAEAGSARGQYVSCEIFLKSSNPGNRYMMGIILAGGKCGVRDEAGAAEYWKAAAAQGDVWSEYRLATLAHVLKPQSPLDLTSRGAAHDVSLSPRHAAVSSLLHAQVLPIPSTVTRTSRCC